MTNFNNVIETSTSGLGDFVSCRTCDTCLEGYYEGVPREDREKVEGEIGKLVVDIIKEALWDVLPSDVNDDFECEYVRMRYYSYGIDKAVFTISYTDNLKDWMLNYVMENKEEFEESLKNNFYPYIRSVPNNWNEWYEGWNKTKRSCVSEVISFMLYKEADFDKYQYSFNEKFITLISENYIPREYAVRFDNDWIMVVKGEYDEDVDGTLYTAWLLDDDENIMNTETMEDMEDPYDDEFHCSAYSILEYTDIKSDLTKGFKVNINCYEPCEVPKI